jgi:hypothetical protein
VSSNNGPEAIEGTVQAVNEKGIKVNGAWYSRSQYGPDEPLPPKASTLPFRSAVASGSRAGGRWTARLCKRTTTTARRPSHGWPV